MKKTLLLFSVLSICFAKAQSITVDDTLTTGDIMFYYAGDSSAVNYDAINGAGATWDYSNLAYANANASTAVKDTVIDIVNSSYAADYPAADYHEMFTGGVQSFISHTPDSTMTHGFVFMDGSNEYIIRYGNDPLKSAHFPMALGSSYSDIIDGDAVLPGGAGTTNLTGSATVSADGTGTLLLGGSTYTDAIRIKTVENLAGNIPFVGAISVIRTSYVYYSPSTSDMPVFIHGQIFGDLGSFGTIDLKSVWSKDMLSGYASVEDELSIQPTELAIFPNPASTQITVTSTNVTQLNIYNAVGQNVLTFSNPEQTKVIDIANLPNGIYFVQVKNGHQIITKKLVIK